MLTIELNSYSPTGTPSLILDVTNGAIVIHTQRLKSDPGGNLLS
ncbi:chemotaxis protein [Escherichia coli]|nr:chemotaxis protein [Escherichia coli]